MFYFFSLFLSIFEVEAIPPLSHKALPQNSQTPETEVRCGFR